MTVCCPTCGQSMIAGRAPIEALSGAPMGAMERKIVDAMVRAFPRALTKSYLIDLLYSDDPDGGPEYAENIIAIMMTRLRKRLPSYGWTIPRNNKGSGHHGAYKLEPLS